MTGAFLQSEIIATDVEVAVARGRELHNAWLSGVRDGGCGNVQQVWCRSVVEVANNQCPGHFSHAHASAVSQMQIDGETHQSWINPGAGNPFVARVLFPALSTTSGAS